MVGEINDRVFVGGRVVVNAQFVFFVQRIINSDFQVSRVILFTIVAKILEVQTGRPFGRLPNALVETLFPAVQMVFAIVLSKLILDSVQRKLPATDAVGKTANERAERSEEHTSELQSPCNLVCRLLLEIKMM